MTELKVNRPGTIEALALHHYLGPLEVRLVLLSSEVVSYLSYGCHHVLELELFHLALTCFSLLPGLSDCLVLGTLSYEPYFQFPENDPFDKLLPLADELSNSKHFPPSSEGQSGIEVDYGEFLLLMKDLLSFESEEDLAKR